MISNLFCTRISKLLNAIKQIITVHGTLSISIEDSLVNPVVLVLHPPPLPRIFRHCRCQNRSGGYRHPKGPHGPGPVEKNVGIFFLQRVVVVKCGIHVTFLELKNF